MSMKTVNPFEIIKELELCLNTDNFKLYDIHVWPFLRNQIVNQFSDRDNTLIKIRHHKRIWKKLSVVFIGIYDFLKLYINDHNKNDSFCSNRRFLFLTSSLSKRICLKNGWYDVYIDPYLDFVEKNNETFIALESSQKMLFKHPRFRKTKLLFLEMLFIYFKSLLLFSFMPKNKEFDILFQKYETKLIEKNCQKCIKNKKDLKFEFLFIRKLSEYFIKKLKIVRPQFVFVVSYYGFTGMAMCHACNYLNIKTIDIQHGVQGSVHPAYGSFFKIPISGYNVMPMNFFNWTGKDAEAINSWAVKTRNIKAYVVGNMAQKVFQQKSSPVGEYFDIQFKDYYNALNDKYFILMTLQNQYIIPDLYINLINKSPNNMFYLIRFHPGSSEKEKNMIRNKLKKKINQASYEIEHASNIPLYTLLRNVQLHITQYSSVVIEAADYKVVSIVTDPRGKNYYNDYITNNEAYYSEDLSSILMLQQKLILIKKEKIAKTFVSDSDHMDAHFFKILNRLMHK